MLFPTALFIYKFSKLGKANYFASADSSFASWIQFPSWRSSQPWRHSKQRENARRKPSARHRGHHSIDLDSTPTRARTWIYFSPAWRNLERKKETTPCSVPAGEWTCIHYWVGNYCVTKNWPIAIYMPYIYTGMQRQAWCLTTYKIETKMFAGESLVYEIGYCVG